MNKRNIAIIGCGRIAEAKHLPCLLNEPRAHVYALCDPIAPGRMQALKDKFSLTGCRLYDSCEALLADENVEVVHICTPNATHAPLAIAALEAGKDVFCEKPMATSLADAEAMAQAARESGRMLTVCANHRYRPESLYLKKLCKEKALGDLYHARASIIRRRGVPTWGSFMSMEAQGGGAVIDVGVHVLDLCLWLLEGDQPVSVSGNVFNRIGKQTSPANPYGNWEAEAFEVEDFGIGLITLESGACVLLEASWALNTRHEKGVSVTLHGSLGGADMDDGLWLNGEMNGKLYDQKIILSQPGVAFNPTAEETPVQLETRLWFDALDSRTPPVVTAEHMAMVMRVINALYESSKTGKSVSLI